MTIRPHPQKNQIETRYFSIGNVKILTNHGFILFGDGLSIREFTGHAMNVISGNGHVFEERLRGHSIIAVRVVRGNVAFIPPKNLDVGPINLRAKRGSRKQFIKTFRRGSAGQRHGKHVSFLNGSARMMNDVSSRGCH